eukprot:tig00020629_g12442.t1
MSAPGSVPKHQLFGTNDYSISWSFGSGPRQPQKQYLSKETTKEHLGRTGPGPIYSVTTSIGDAPKFSIGGAGRAKSGLENASPGPAYNVTAAAEKETGPRYGFGTAPRKGMGIANDEPGPGAHARPNDKGEVEGPRWTFGSTGRGRMGGGGRDATPGPGAYPVDNDPSAQKAPAATFGKSNRDGERKRFLSKEMEKDQKGWGTPGPGKYELDNAVQPVGRQSKTGKQANAPQHVFGSRDRFPPDKREAVPGPGAYERREVDTGVMSPTKTVDARPVFSKSTRDLGSRSSSAPGPGQYPLKGTVGEHLPRWGFGTSEQRTNLHPTVSPGPIYNTDANQGKVDGAPQFSFGTATRDQQKKVFMGSKLSADEWGKGSPGPVYHPPSKMGETTSYGFAKASRGVGVGADGAKGKKKTRSGEIPGPGAYNLRPTVGTLVDPTVEKSPAVRIGTSQRDNERQHRFIAKGMDKDMVGKDTPGPGAYEARSAIAEGTHSTLRKSPVPGFGTSDRDREKKRYMSAELSAKNPEGSSSQANPGPGLYKPLIMTMPWRST